MKHLLFTWLPFSIHVADHDNPSLGHSTELESAGMDEKNMSRIWVVFEEVAPNLCYIGRTRDMLENLLAKAEDCADLLGKLDRVILEEENPSFGTDLKILMGRLKDKGKKPMREG